jgi:hypothetical protein
MNENKRFSDSIGNLGQQIGGFYSDYTHFGIRFGSR